MTLEDKKELFIVVSVVSAISIAVFISLITKFNISDLWYFIVCIIFLIRYISIKIGR